MTTDANANEQLRLQRLEAASEWLLRMQSTTHTEQELNEWLRWIDSDPENFAEFERLQRDWIDLDALKSGEPVANNDVVSRPAVARRTWAIAAGIAAVSLAVATFYLRERPPAVEVSQQVAATVTNRATTLPDGSSMILGVQSRVNMDFNDSKRQLALASGEAYFKVMHDKSRPFVVHAGEVSVTAIGTAFDVRRENERVSITVEEGTVEVSSRPAGKRPVTWRAEAGYQLTYSTRDGTASVASVSPAAELAWRNGELAYIRESLGSVVENLNRYSTRKVVIQDPEIAGLAFTGTVFASSLDDWLAGVEQAYPIAVERNPNGDIVLTARR